MHEVEELEKAGSPLFGFFGRVLGEFDLSQKRLFHGVEDPLYEGDLADGVEGTHLFHARRPDFMAIWENTAPSP